MNFNETNRADALSSLIASHMTLGGTASTITDYIDDPACISSPSMIELLDTVIGSDPDDAEITELHEWLTKINPDLATQIALRAELCDACSSDAECCTCE